MTGSAEPPKQVVLITGASRGLGLALARAVVALGKYRVVLTARGQSLERFELEGLRESSDVWFHPLDVSLAPEREALAEDVARRWGGVDILVNNAGTMMRAVLEHVGDADHQKQMEINYRAPMELSRLMLPAMRERGHGRIINISSVGGMMAMPTMSVYSASKFALEGASEALYYEVRPWNIFVTLVQPGFINSDAFERIAYTDRSRAAQDNPLSPYHRHYHYMAAFIASIMGRAPATPESVAKKIVRLLEKKRPPLRVSGTTDAFLFSMMRRLLPRSLYHEILYRSLPGIARWGKVRSGTAGAASER